MKFLLFIALTVVSIKSQYSNVRSQILEDFVNGNQQFSADVYRQIQKNAPGNFLVCPLSVKIVLALTQVGARGKTAQQISTALYLPENPEIVQRTFWELLPLFQGTNKYILNSANKIYVKNGVEISSRYKSIAVDIFRADIANINFAKKRQAAFEMNNWVEQNTHGRIRNLISPAALSRDTRAVLINALYFKGTWINTFRPEVTRSRPFFLNKYHQVEVDMMMNTGRFNYYENYELNAKFLELFYEGYDISMTFVLPNDMEGLSALESRIGEVLVNPRYNIENVIVQIPKFKIETTIKFKTILKEMGIHDAFEDAADFSGIISNKEVIKISEVIQKTFIEVDEKGTEAAAATAVIILPGSAPPSQMQPPPKMFIADHPFIYYLKSSVAGIMFVGRYIQHS